MPITKRAKKKMRRDHRRAGENIQAKRAMTATVKKARRSPTKKTLSDAFRALDKAAKKRRIHPNKAARLKSRLSKRLKSK
jgi:small subunit ribosomal protein S20